MKKYDNEQTAIHNEHIIQMAKQIQKFYCNVFEDIPKNIVPADGIVTLFDNDMGKNVNGKITEIPPLSEPLLYADLYKGIDRWTEYQQKYNEGTVLHLFRKHNIPQSWYLLRLDIAGVLEGVVGIEVKREHFWVRELNTAPWNQESAAFGFIKYKGVGLALMARIISICFQCGRFPLKLYAVSNHNTINFYTNLGGKNVKGYNYFKATYPGFEFDKEQCKEVLKKFNKYQSNK